MTVRGWLTIGGQSAAWRLSTTAALVGPFISPTIPDAADVEPGRWILYQPPGVGVEPVVMVCVEVPLP